MVGDVACAVKGMATPLLIRLHGYQNQTSVEVSEELLTFAYTRSQIPPGKQNHWGGLRQTMMKPTMGAGFLPAQGIYDHEDKSIERRIWMRSGLQIVMLC